MKNVLLVNPWIYDFAAYDLWIKPWGLLKLSRLLKDNGFDVEVLDCLDRHHPTFGESVKDHKDGTGKFHSEIVDKPLIYEDIPRTYRRYGLAIDSFESLLPRKKYDIILVSSGMTYWYPGAFEAIKILRRVYGKTTIVLGGVYATLNYDHARKHSGSDYVLRNGDFKSLQDILQIKEGLSFKSVLEASIDFNWYDPAPYSVLRLSLGCPYDCKYCAQRKLNPSFMLKDIDLAFEEIEELYARGIKRFAFYDDALLFNTEYITKYLKGILRRGMKAEFYTPNGLHARFVTKEVASLMFQAGFNNPILSLEISNENKGSDWHTKVSNEEFERAVSFLKEAGYGPGEYTTYLMLGAPGSDLADVAASVEYIHALGGRTSLSEFSPISGTEMSKGYEGIDNEPLLQNNSAFPTYELTDWEKVQKIKNTVRKLNTSFTLQ